MSEPPIHRFTSVKSTQDEARRLAREGAPHGTIVVAQEQTGGRGQHGHTWASPPGGLYMSMVLRDVAQPTMVSLALGNAVAETLEVAGVEPRIKWVNDVLVGDKKVAGVLVEAESTGSRVDFLVAGIGINVNGKASRFPADVRPLATTLEDELGCDSCLPDVEALLVANLQRHLAILRDEPGQVLALVRQRDALLGRRVRIHHPAETVEGTACGLGPQGHLLLDIAGQKRSIQSGSVEILA